MKIKQQKQRIQEWNDLIAIESKPVKDGTNNRPQDDWFMKDPKWYAIGNAIMPLLLLSLWALILSSILFGL